MSKVERSNIARGVYLDPAHVFTPLQAMKAELEAANIGAEQMDDNWADFEITLSVPFIDSKYIEHTLSRLTADRAGFAWPFVVPPLQEFFNAAGQIDEAHPPVILDAISFAFDQRGEPAAIVDQSYGDGAAAAVGGNIADAGKMLWDKLSRLDVELVLTEKTPTFFGGYTAHTTIANYEPENQIFSVSIPALSFSRANRLNPFVRDGFNEALHPYKSYLLTLYCDGLFDAADPTERLALVNPQVTLYCRSRLVARDKNTGGSNVVQNCPAHNADPTPPTITLNTPAGGSPLEADSGDGVQTGLDIIDDQLRVGLWGGLNRYGDHFGEVHTIADDASYFCWVIPMWANQHHGEVNKVTIDFVNLNGGPPHSFPVMDIRQIPLAWPITIHHVFASVSWQSSQATATYGNAIMQDLRHDIGVGLGSGLRGDHPAYTEIARLDWLLDDLTSGTTHMDHLIDRLRPISKGVSAASPKYSHELMAIPLHHYVGPYGAGFVQQGHPVFAAPGWSMTQARSNIGDSATAGGVAPPTDGVEQWLEVRWEIDPTPVTNFDAVGGVAADALFHGYGGGHVIIIGKRHLV